MPLSLPCCWHTIFPINTNAINVFILRWTPRKILDVLQKVRLRFSSSPALSKAISCVRTKLRGGEEDGFVRNQCGAAWDLYSKHRGLCRRCHQDVQKVKGEIQAYGYGHDREATGR